MYIVYVPVKKIFTNGPNMGLLLWVLAKKKVHGQEIHSGNENVPDAAVSKEGHADSILEQERTHPWKKRNFK